LQLYCAFIPDLTSTTTSTTTATTTTATTGNNESTGTTIESLAQTNAEVVEIDGQPENDVTSSEIILEGDAALSISETEDPALDAPQGNCCQTCLKLEIFIFISLRTFLG
jgi:hypothetical protein